jgi:outer membrane protein
MPVALIRVLAGLLAATLSLAQESTSRAPSAGSGLDLLSVLQSALDGHPGIAIRGEEVEIARGLLEQRSGEFSRVTSSSFTQLRIENPLTHSQELLYSSTGQTSALSHFGLGATQLFRNGISIGPQLGVDRSHDNVNTPLGLSSSRLSFQVTVPLLRGRGRDAVAGGEAAAGIEVDAALLDLNDTVATVLADAASGYWELVASLGRLKVAADSEWRGQSLLEYTEALVAADRLPRNEMDNAAANLAARVADRIAAEQTLTAARTQLALRMGLRAREIPLLATPTDEFPKVNIDGQTLPDERSIAAYVTGYIEHRSDLLAAKRRGQESAVRLKVAQNHLRPQVDLILNTGYSGLNEGRSLASYLISPYQSVRGANVSGGITFSYPRGNLTARGEVREAVAIARKADRQIDDLLRRVTAEITKAVADVRISADRLGATQEAVGLYQRALEGEREKFRLGRNSLVDILTIEDRLTSALSNQVLAQLSFANALVELRLATGTIVSPDRRVHSISKQLFITLPPMPPQAQ